MLKKISMSNYVYEKIKDQIIKFDLKPGEKISENEISNVLGVSRTPVREAFIRLKKDMLLNIIPQKGTYVSHIDLDLVEEARFIRESLELAVFQLAAEDFPEEYIVKLKENIYLQEFKIKENLFMDFLQLDEKFHSLIFEGCNKSLSWDMIEQLNSQYKRIRMLTFIEDMNWDKTISQHKALVEYIESGDADKGKEILKDHIGKLKEEQIILKEKYKDYFTE